MVNRESKGALGTRLRELLTFARPQRSVLAMAMVLSLVATVAELAQPLIAGRVIDAVANTGVGAGAPNGSFRSWAALLVALFVFDAVLSGLQGYLLGRSGEGIVLGVRRSLIGRLLRLPVAAHDRHRTGDLLSRVGTDTTLLRSALTSSLVYAVSGVLFFVGALALMAAIDSMLLLVALSCVLVATAVVFLISTRIRAASEEAQRRVGRLGAALERTLGAIRTVKISGAEAREEASISGEAEAAYRAGVRVARLEALVNPAAGIALQAAFVLILGIGAARLATGAITLGDLSAFLLYLFYLASPLIMIFTSVTDLQQGMAAFARIKEVLNEPEERGPSPARKPIFSSRASEPVVRFDRVTFGYDSERPVLKEVSFEVPENSRTALVGPSGAGKSTVFALLESFYGADSGAIYLDGTDLRDLPLDELRSNIGYVEQDAPVMAGSVLSNLLYARPDATEGELEEVLNLANLRPFVGGLPQGLDTEVGDSGITLSGGERQRVAIARTLLARPRLLLLDEVTSQLDTRNELALREAVDRVSGRCTVMVIAHRLSTVADSDRILILDDGRLRGAGTHEELMRSDPLYRELATHQLITNNV